ncbi:MAG: esterase [Pseudomonadales bacterium]|nr:esterase [Pseudomonadales bacterium]
MRPPYLIYIHGFNSSPDSYKAEYLRRYLAQMGWQDNYLVPALDYRPIEAMIQLTQFVEQRLPNFNITLIGSSLGGYYATFLTERYGVNSVLINPAVAPYRMMQENMGVHHNYHTEMAYEITPLEVEQLRQLETFQLKQANKYLVLLQTGDNTLDYREAEIKYAAAKLVVQDGGSHGFENFDRVVPEILHFAGMEDNINSLNEE